MLVDLKFRRLPRIGSSYQYKTLTVDVPTISEGASDDEIRTNLERDRTIRENAIAGWTVVSFSINEGGSDEWVDDDADDLVEGGSVEDLDESSHGYGIKPYKGGVESGHYIHHHGKNIGQINAYRVGGGGGRVAYTFKFHAGKGPVQDEMPLGINHGIDSRSIAFQRATGLHQNWLSKKESVEDLDESSNSKQGRWAHLIHDSDFRVTHQVHFMGKKIGEVYQSGNQHRPVYHHDHPGKVGPKKSLDLAPSAEHAIEAIKKHHKKVWVPYGNDDK